MSLPLNPIYWIDFMSTLPERIADWTQTYCESLEENYKQYHIRSMETFTSDYAKQQLEDVKNGTANLMRFRMESGRKYWKIIQQDYDTFRDRNCLLYTSPSPRD